MSGHSQPRAFARLPAEQLQAGSRRSRVDLVTKEPPRTPPLASPSVLPDPRPLHLKVCGRLYSPFEGKPQGQDGGHKEKGTQGSLSHSGSERGKTHS